MEWKASERTNYSSRYDLISDLLDTREERQIQVREVPITVRILLGFG
ncbi:hypothetical protein LINPERHAP2_LOCUS40191 [Linum perenne]